MRERLEKEIKCYNVTAKGMPKLLKTWQTAKKSYSSSKKVKICFVTYFNSLAETKKIAILRCINQ